MIELGEKILAVLLWLAAFVGAVSLIASKVVPIRRALGQRFRRWLDSTVGAVVDERLNYRNAGRSLRDSIDRLEKGLAELRASADDRAALATEAAQRIEHRLDRLEDVTMRRHDR